ncbi:MAG: hypothetical protein ABW185_24600 [Sedimenticola sp.]
MHSAHVDNLTKQKDDNDDKDNAFERVISAMNNEVTRLWNSVELIRLYQECEGSRLSRRGLISAVKEHFNESLLVLSSPGVASLIVFREQCALNIVDVQGDDDNIAVIAKSIATETVKPEKWVYQTRLNHYNVNANVSSTLLNLLGELKMSRLSSSMVASIITSHLTKSPTLLQIAISNYLKRKMFVEELHHFGVTVNYDEFKRFKASAAAAAMSNNSPHKDLLSGAHLIQSVGDNFDATICSQNGLKQTHSMALIMTQTMPSASPDSDSTDDPPVIRKLRKDELKEPVMPALSVHRYKGPKKPPMPEEDSRREVPSLKVLAHQVVSTTRAHSLDFMFLKSVVSQEITPEFNGFNTQHVRHAGCGLQPGTRVIYLPMVDMPPAEPDTMLTSMFEVKRITEEAGQKYTIFTNDQQLYKIAVEMTWYNPDEFQNFIPRLGGMHYLMSFIGCVGTLMAESGLSEILQAAFASVPLMLRGKKFPYNMRALRMLAEEVLRELILGEDVQSFEEMISLLDTRSTESRTTHLWVDSLIKPVILMMQFVRAEREGDWPLHLSAATAMLPYFAAAGHWNYFRYGTVYIMKMAKMPMDLLKHFMNGEHVMRHQAGLWNAIWSDMMIETTAMRYGHGPAGVIGITLNQKALQRWALAHPISSQLEKDLLDMNENHYTKQMTVHKEESEARIKSDAEDRRKLRVKLDSCIPPLTPSEHPPGLVNIVSGKLAPDKVNVDEAYSVGCQQLATFQDGLPDKFYQPLSKEVVTMEASKKSIQIGNVNVYDTTLIYSRVIALQLSRNVSMVEVLKFELAPIPTSMFLESGDMRTSGSKSVLKNKLGVQIPSRTAESPDVIVIDGCALLWTVNWPVNGIVEDFVDNFCQAVLWKLKNANVNLIFDRYYDYSTKSGTRAARGKAACRSHKLNRQTQLPPQNTVLTNTANKTQIIDLICTDIVSRAQVKCAPYRLIVTGSSATPHQVLQGQITDRLDLTTTHEEADIIIVQQVINEVTNDSNTKVQVLCDDTDVFVLLVYFYWSLHMSCQVILEGTHKDRTLIDIQKTVRQHKEIIPSLISAHALSGCDTVAYLYGIGKGTVLKKLKSHTLNKVGRLDADMTDILQEATTFISACYGQQSEDMSDARARSWAAKTAQSRSKTPKLCSFPPTTESFHEHVKRAHLQAIYWFSTPNPHPPNLDPTEYGWIRHEQSKSLDAVAIPSGVPPAPPAVMQLIKCSCSSSKPCSTYRCSCLSAQLACTVFCKCAGQIDTCYSDRTKDAAAREGGGDDTLESLGNDDEYL